MDIAQLYQKYKDSTGVCTDTRKIESGVLFFALKGGNFDGNKFAEQALNEGAIAVVVDDKSVVKNQKYILVDNVLEALQHLARYHRDQFTIPVIGITGSNGKTTTKELLNAVLSEKYKVHYTRGNLNNHIGVPLTLLAMPEVTEIAVIEMGANHQGEIASLCKIANPDHGLITNIGKAHLEGFGGLEGVARGKSELYLHLKENGGEVFVNARDEHLMRMSTRLTAPKYYLAKDGYYNAELIESTPFLKYRSQEGRIVATQILGDYNFNNIVAALCVAKFFKVPEEKANKAVANYVSDNNRSQIVKWKGKTVLLDAYNANPSSMAAAIQNFTLMSSDYKVMVLGDMFELGRSSSEEHRKISELAINSGVKEVYFVGKEFYAVESNKAKFYPSKEEILSDGVLERLPDGATILIKGSRGMGLEQLIK